MVRDLQSSALSYRDDVARKIRMNSALNPTREPEGNVPVTVILERRRANSEWADFTWRASGITCGEHANNGLSHPVRETSDLALFLVGGLDIALYEDECESYYFNLVSDTPRAYVLAHSQGTDAPPEPFRVSMSFDEAHAYLEGDDEIFEVDVPAELYMRVESFVIANYFPEKKTKRKLRDWTADGRDGQPDDMGRR